MIRIRIRVRLRITRVVATFLPAVVKRLPTTGVGYKRAIPFHDLLVHNLVCKEGPSCVHLNIIENIRVYVGPEYHLLMIYFHFP